MGTTDEFLKGYDEGGVEREIARLEALKEELALVRRLKALRASQSGGTSGAKAGREPVPNGKPSTTAEAGGVPLAPTGTAPATRRQAIEAVMKSDPGRVWKLSEIRDTLIQRGWLAATDENYHRLQVAVSRMFKRNQLERPETGYYKLPPAKQAALEDAAGSAER